MMIKVHFYSQTAVEPNCKNIKFHVAVNITLKTKHS